MQSENYSGHSYMLPTHPPYISNITSLATSGLGIYPNPLNSHLDNHHSNIPAGTGLNNMNRDGGFVFNPSSSFGYHPHPSAASYGTGSGQPVLNNLTLNNQIPQPRPRANNYWDNFRRFEFKFNSIYWETVYFIFIVFIATQLFTTKSA
jgi:hypothetical protein